MNKNYIISALIVIVMIGAIFITYILSSNSNVSDTETNTATNVHIRATKPGASESGEIATVVLFREGGKISKPLTVDLRLSGKAIIGTDYNLTASDGDASTISTNEIYTFPEDVSSVTFNVIPIDDSVVERFEGVRFESVDFALTWDNRASLASISIEDND